MSVDTQSVGHCPSKQFLNYDLLTPNIFMLTPSLGMNFVFLYHRLNECRCSRLQRQSHHHRALYYRFCHFHEVSESVLA